jgi:hypothetical protein
VPAEDVHAAPLLVQNSVTEEHVVGVALTTGPVTTVPTTLLVIGTAYKVGFPPLSPQTQRFPVGLDELLDVKYALSKLPW